MGGGGAMRSATKAVGLGVIGSSYRSGSSSIHLTDFASRNSVVSVAPTVSPSINEVKNSTISVSSQNRSTHVASVHRQLRETDDWEFIHEIEEEGEYEQILNPMDPIPKLVFGAVPTLQEAKEATSDLKDALDKLYPSSSNASGNKSCSKVQEFTFPRPANFENSKTKTHVTTDSGVTLHSEPKHAFQAFALLKQSHEVQEVVASLASDKNVWEAVMKNKEVLEFYKSMDRDKNKCAAGSKAERSLRDECDDEKSSESSEDGFMEFVEKMKLRVLAMVGNLSEFLQHIFGGAEVAESSFENTIKRSTFAGTCLMGLAIAVIMVIMVKRA